MAKELTNEEQLDRFADLLDPIIEIVNDPSVKEKARHSPAEFIKAAIKNHKTAFVKILALFEGVAYEDYKVPDPLTMLVKALKILDKPEISVLFPSRSQKGKSGPSGSVTGNTEDGAN